MLPQVTWPFKSCWCSPRWAKHLLSKVWVYVVVWSLFLRFNSSTRSVFFFFHCYCLFFFVEINILLPNLCSQTQHRAQSQGASCVAFLSHLQTVVTARWSWWSQTGARRYPVSSARWQSVSVLLCSIHWWCYLPAKIYKCMSAVDCERASSCAHGGGAGRTDRTEASAERRWFFCEWSGERLRLRAVVTVYVCCLFCSAWLAGLLGVEEGGGGGGGGAGQGEHGG